MALLAIVLLPLVVLGLGYALRLGRLGRLLALLGCALAHGALVSRLWLVPTPTPALGGHLALDPLGLLFLSIVSVVFVAVAVYSLHYRRFARPDEQTLAFFPCKLLLLSALSALALGRHMGVLWVLSGVGTLGVTPLMYVDRGPRALEATWKYLIICSVGVAFALLGIFFLAIASTDPAGPPPKSLGKVLGHEVRVKPVDPSGAAPGLFIDDLLDRARDGRVDPAWLRAAFVFMLVGFGTKVGLSPMHTWKPDAYSEAPTPVAALMATGICACMFLCLLRAYQVCVAAGQGPFASGLLVFMGLLSIATGAAFVVAQGDYTRLLAYSGVEHMGVVALGVGIGGIAIYAALLHMIGHSLVKGALFFCAGNVRRTYGTRSISEITGALRRMPVTATLLFAGTFAALGFPPFSMFLSELMILRGALTGGSYVVAGLYLLLLGVVFVAVMSLVQEMVQGPDPRGPGATPEREPLLLTFPALALLALALGLGLHIPARLHRGLEDAAKLVGG